MKTSRIFTSFFVLIAASFLFTSCNCDQNESTAKKVELKKEAGNYSLFVDGQPFYVKGAGLEGGDIAELAARGGNTMRTWRTDNQFRKGQEILDEALENGIMVCMGIEIARERHGFDYDNEAAVQKQLEYAKQEVLKYKDHPALLAWGIGNELNLHAENPKVWDAVNEIAAMIHETDPNHPTTTMLAGAAPEMVDVVVERCPNLDFLSFQLYGDIVNLPKYLENGTYEGAYIVSEWGPTGHWEMPATEWGRPIEQNSSEKAASYLSRYKNVIAADRQHCIGSFVFLWGQKQERTPTWYGLFHENGESTEAVDVMEYVWTGKWPENRAPQLISMSMNNKNAHGNIILDSGEEFTATVSAVDPDGDTLTYYWEIMPEVAEHKQSDGGDHEERPESLLHLDAGQEGQIITAQAPVNPGEYRLLAYARDQKGHAAYANIPFKVIKTDIIK